MESILDPRHRYSSPVKVAIYIYGDAPPGEEEEETRRHDAGEFQTEDQQGPDVGRHARQPNDIWFEGLKKVDASREARRTVMRLHVNMGHPSQEQLMRFAKYCDSSKEVEKCIKCLRCSWCLRNRPPTRPVV